MIKFFKQIYRDAMRYRHIRESVDDEMWDSFKNIYPFATTAFDKIVDKSMGKKND